MRASGLQIAFLAFAVQFFAMLLAGALAPRLAGPGHDLEFAGRLATFGAAAAILFGVPALRRHCLTQLRAPARAGAMELALAIATKVTITFALVGATVLVALATGEASIAESRLGHNDPHAEWRWLMTPVGLATTVALGWFVGPLIEEIVFRGLLQPAFERAWGWAIGSAVNSVLFALMHPGNLLAAGLGSLVMACLWRRTRSLRDCIVVHAGFNIAVSWPLLGQVLFAPPAQPLLAPGQWAPHFVALAVAAVALPAWAWVAARRPA